MATLLDDILSALGPRVVAHKANGEIAIWCPFHPDGEGNAPHNPNLVIKPGNKGAAYVWACPVCNIGGTLLQLAERLREIGMMQPREKADEKIVKTYPYCDEEGRPLFEVLRFANKRFSQRRPDGKDGWIWNLEGVRRVPYRLPELLAADPAEWVHVVEGEKDANNLSLLGLVATTNPSGAGKWREEFSPYFKGRKVAILPDNDTPGQAHAQDVARKLTGHAAETRLVNLPGLSPGGDVSDWLKLGHKAGELMALVDAAPSWRATASPTLAPLLDDGDRPEKPRQERAQRPPAPRYVARFPGLVDIVQDADGQPQFLVLVDGKPSLMSEWQGQLPPPSEQLPFLLPRADVVLEHYERGEDTNLFDDLVAYHAGVSQLPSDDHALLLAAFTAHTYIMERWQYSPILCLFAVPERGKSRTGKGVAYAAYRGLHTETLQEANLFRWSSDLGATLLLDVKDLWRKAEKRQSEDILLQRFEQGAKVGRVLYPERGAFRDTRYFDVFGPTIIATNEGIDNILDTRALTLVMPDADHDFPNPVTPEAGLPFKERLVAFRARYLEIGLPHPPRLAQARLGDIVHPLATIIQIMAPQHCDRFRALIRGIEADRLSDRSATLEGRILEAMLGLTGEIEAGKLGTAAITASINEGWPEKWQKSTESVGRKLKALGFIKGRLTGGARAIEYDQEKVGRLAERYGVRLPPAEPSQLSQPSLPDTNEPTEAGEPSLTVTEPSLEPSLPPRYESDSSDASDGSSAPRDTHAPADDGPRKLAFELWEGVGCCPIPYKPGHVIFDLGRWLRRATDEEVAQVVDLLEAMPAPKGGSK